MTKRELESRFTGKDINDWMAYYHLEPFGQERADLRSALQVAALSKLLNNEKVSMYDMMPYTDKPKQTWQMMKAFCMALVKKGRRKK